MKLIVGVTGATGTIFAVRLLETLSGFPDVEVHLVLSDWAINNLLAETATGLSDLAPLAAGLYANSDLAACLASGSYRTDGMIIVPCSMKTLAAIANGYSDNLITRAADVCIKEGRKLVICPRETPLNAIHLENMLKLSRLGVKLVPPMPAFYYRPITIDDLVNHHVMKLLDQFGLESPHAARWNGVHQEGISR